MSTADLVRFSKAEIPRQQAYVQSEEGSTAGLRAAEATREGWDSRNLGRMLGKLYDWTPAASNLFTGRGSCRCVVML
jgi:hypothetical protein